MKVAPESSATLMSRLLTLGGVEIVGMDDGTQKHTLVGQNRFFLLLRLKMGSQVPLIYLKTLLFSDDKYGRTQKVSICWVSGSFPDGGRVCQVELATLAHGGRGLSSRGQLWCQKRLFNYVHRQLFKSDIIILYYSQTNLQKGEALKKKTNFNFQRFAECKLTLFWFLH